MAADANADEACALTDEEGATRRDAMRCDAVVVFIERDDDDGDDGCEATVDVSGARDRRERRRRSSSREAWTTRAVVARCRVLARGAREDTSLARVDGDVDVSRTDASGGFDRFRSVGRAVRTDAIGGDGRASRGTRCGVGTVSRARRSHGGGAGASIVGE